MALARCETCGWPHKGTTNVYSKVLYLPAGHPDSGLICGTTGCSNPAMIWPTELEEIAYRDADQRIFSPTGDFNHAKFKVQES